ncbi:MAG: L,D-transpeptidase family protein [Deltaproteobacteria bacterium]|nr:L,D-transpeptidase family protein [Deltaproteobacteria bacterium]
MAAPMGVALLVVACASAPEAAGRPAADAARLAPVAGIAPASSHRSPPGAPPPAAAASASALAAPARSAEGALLEESPPVRRVSDWNRDGAATTWNRAARALSQRATAVRQLFADAGVAFPPAQMLLRGFKQERRLEAWAASTPAEPLAHVTTYEICYASGTLGPKRKQGDHQTPEGFYGIDYFDPQSRWHLALHVSYPNRSDRILGDRRDPGDGILIHGKCASVGCISLTDERIEELWTMAKPAHDAGTRVHVQLLPSRNIPALLASAEHPEHGAFWENLQPGVRHFELSRRVPRVGVQPDGRYVFE